MLCIVIMLRWLFKHFSDASLLADLEEVRNDLAHLRTQMNMFQSEIIEEILARTEKLSKRMQTRMHREEQIEEPKSQVPARKFFGGGSFERMGLKR